MNDYWNDPPEYPEPPSCPKCKENATEVESDGLTCRCEECGHTWKLEVEPPEDVEWLANFEGQQCDMFDGGGW